ncbi:MAG: HAD-IIIC family phosphatase [Fibromonadales bacterium]|nr:HAD-IIIC family phosphatase [Fibromonadales bacterium]
MTFNQLKKLSKQSGNDLPVIRVALLGDTATQLLATAIKGMGQYRNFNIELFEADFNQIEMQFFNKDSELHKFNADFTIVFQSTHKLLGKKTKDRLPLIKEILNSFKGKIIYFNYAEIDDSVFGSFANKLEMSFVYQIRKMNFDLMNLAIQNSDFHILDIASIQNKYGRNFMFSPAIYASTEMILSIDCLPIVANRIFDIICASKGNFKKCVVLDLDNTLWGGIAGDDGLENLKLGHGLGIGKIFVEFQEWLKKLKERGIILAVCSKNEESTAKEVFEKHPEMVLKLDDISVFIANWENKADNIRKIQSVLNIGFDSIVFMDDNPAEREIVRQNLSAVCVPELPKDPAEWLEFLYGENLFETVSFSQEDKERTKQYREQVERTTFEQSFTNETDFLKSLEMECEVEDFTKFNIPRIAQLSQRSNQFNLRTVRYSEADIQNLSNNENYKNFAFSLKDKFGDNGLIAVVILEKRSKELFIESWFMSCRVLKRGMESFTLNTIAKYAKENSFEKITGEYLPTAKNKLVENHYKDLGFVSLGAGKFELKICNYAERECFILSKEIE